jgi:hypothetical protein
MNTLDKALNAGFFIAAIVGTVFTIGIVALVVYGIYNEMVNEPVVTQVTGNCVLIKHGPFKDVKCYSYNTIDGNRKQ